MQPTIQDAIRAIDPTLAFHISPDGVPSLTNLSGTLPSKEEIDAKLAELTAEYDNNKYQRDRQPNYPPMTDYLDGIVKGDQAQIDKYIADCLAVKEKYPKGEN